MKDMTCSSLGQVSCSQVTKNIEVTQTSSKTNNNRKHTKRVYNRKPKSKLLLYTENQL